MVRSVLILGFPGVQSLDLAGPYEDDTFNLEGHQLHTIVLRLRGSFQRTLRVNSWPIPPTFRPTNTTKT
jgi:hypothetical protein